jgi:hypothetical protein
MRQQRMDQLKERTTVTVDDQLEKTTMLHRFAEEKFCPNPQLSQNNVFN